MKIGILTGGGDFTPLHPIMGEILREKFGIMVYREDVSRFAMAIAGFDGVDADLLISCGRSSRRNGRGSGSRTTRKCSTGARSLFADL